VCRSVAQSFKPLAETEEMLTKQINSNQPNAVAGDKGGNNADACRRPILSVDVEDYFHVEGFADHVSRESWNEWPTRVERNTERLLDLFDESGTKATFFVLGWIAAKFPNLVRSIAQRGHELACHSYWHRCVYRLTAAEFREDTVCAKRAIEQAAGIRVRGYRAPSWSITAKSLWALDILAEEGFEYDSSIYPIHHDIYGLPGALRIPYVHRLTGDRQLLEFPPATVSVAGVVLPAAGGGYLRLFPFVYTAWAIGRMEAAAGQQVVVYVHPWEIDPEQPRIAGRLRSKLRHYTNLGSTEQKLRRLLSLRRFQSFEQLLAGGAFGGAQDNSADYSFQRQAIGTQGLAAQSGSSQ
jgi:polysaccharide deacetylase family protein (PEP-CTERM system associated)